MGAVITHLIQTLLTDRTDWGEMTVEEAHKKLTTTCPSHDDNASARLEEFLRESRAHYDALQDTLPLGNYIGILISLWMPTLMAAVKQGRSMENLKVMSLRELLQVIKFLIETTAKYHEYIQETIPTVGGDIYYATITRNEGLVFRNPEERF